MKALVFVSVFALSISVFAIKETTPTQCEKDSDCIIVPYQHCCGSTKKAINKKFLESYKKNKSWQKYDDPKACAVMGACVSDAKVKEAKCEDGQCRLHFPAE